MKAWFALLGRLHNFVSTVVCWRLKLANLCTIRSDL